MRIAYDAPLSGEARALLEAGGAELVAVPEASDWAEAAECDGLLYSAEGPLPEVLLRRPRRLAAVALLGAEPHDEVRRAAADRAGLLLLAPSRSEAASVAEFAMLCLLRAARAKEEELSGKTLGIIGFEEAGAALAARARAFGMRVLAWSGRLNRGRTMLYDVEASDLVDLLVSADAVVNLELWSEERRGRFGKDEIQLLREGATLVHLADPALLAMDEVERALDWGYLQDFWIDLPPGHEREAAQLAPYLGERLSVHAAGNTRQARQARQLEMAADLLAALAGETVASAINLPRLSALERSRSREAVRLAFVLGAMMGARLERVPRRLRLTLGGALVDLPRAELARYLLASFARALGDREINAISAPSWAKERGIDIDWQSAPTEEDGMTVEVVAARGRLAIGGLLQRGRIFLHRFDDYALSAEPTAHLLLIPHVNRPGMVGHIGTLLGARAINIRGMVLGHKPDNRDSALMWIMLDGAPDRTLLDEVSALPGCWQAEYIALPPLRGGVGEAL